MALLMVRERGEEVESGLEWIEVLRGGSVEEKRDSRASTMLEPTTFRRPMKTPLCGWRGGDIYIYISG